MNLRALRFVVVELLRGFVDDMVCRGDLDQFLKEVASKSVLAEHWVNNLIKPVFLMMLYFRAEREGEFRLHLYACKQMIPCFFAAGHVNYARYGLCYIKTMETLPTSILHPFLLGEHVARHQEGIWNAIWTDMIDWCNQQTMDSSDMSLDSCNTVLKDLDDLREKEEPIKTYHKEESHARIASDEIDRENLRNFLKTCIHPLDVNSQQSKTSLCNIYTGQHAPKSVNVNKSVQLGSKQMKELEAALPERFHNTIQKKVVTMKEMKKKVKTGDAVVYNTEVIYSRVMCSLNAKQSDLKDIFKYEFSPVPVSLFDDNADSMLAKQKVYLKNTLKEEVYCEHV